MGNLTNSCETPVTLTTVPLLITENTKMSSKDFLAPSKNVPAIPVKSSFNKMNSVRSLNNSPECISGLISTFDLLIHTSKSISLHEGPIYLENNTPR